MARSPLDLSKLAVLGLLVFSLFTAWQLIFVPTWRRIRQEKSASPRTTASDISVGFNLAPYGSIAVEYPNGTVYVERVDGDDGYQEMMARLSLDSSSHLAPPYDNLGDKWDDAPRKMKRDARKAIGLPASADVAIISKVIDDLRVKAESRLSIKISSAVVSVSHLVAIYQDDMQDAFEYLKMKYIEVPRYFRPLVWETAVAFAGYGLGLCDNYTDCEGCHAEEHDMPEVTTFAVHYARNALTTSLAVMKTARALWEPDYRHTENFTLGNDQRWRYPQKEKYWEAVRDELRKIMVEFRYYPRPSKILLMGEEASNEKFLDVLKDAMLSLMDEMPEIYGDDVVFAAVRGTAEFMKRARYYPCQLHHQETVDL